MATQKEKGMRLTSTRGRGQKRSRSGYRARHLDRDFDLNSAPHIDPARTKDNRYWHCYQDTPGLENLKFIEAEKRFYREHFQKGLEAQNQRYIKGRHKEKCKTMSQLREQIRSAPEEMIFQIGNATVGQPDPQIIMDVFREYQQWHKQRFPQIGFLNYALHADEFSFHIHARQVYIGHDQDGNEMPNQTRCLTEMGVPLPLEAGITDKKHPRFNNRKLTYTAMCREQLISMCQERGLELITEPKPTDEVGLSLTEYKTREEKKKAQALQQQNKEAQQQLIRTENKILDAEAEQAMAEDLAATSQKNLARVAAQVALERQKLSEATSQTQQVQSHLEAVRAAETVEQQKLSKAKELAAEARRKAAEAEDGLDVLLDMYYCADALMRSDEAERILDFLSEKYPDVLREWHNSEQELEKLMKSLCTRQERKQPQKRPQSLRNEDLER